MPKALVREGCVQNDRERLYSLKKVNREVESRGKNFKAIGVPARDQGEKPLVSFMSIPTKQTDMLVQPFTSLSVHSQHDFAIRAFAHELQELKVLGRVHRCQRLSRQMAQVIQELCGSLGKTQS